MSTMLRSSNWEQILIEIKLLATCTDGRCPTPPPPPHIAVNWWTKHNWKICDWFIYIFPSSPFCCLLVESRLFSVAYIRNQSKFQNLFPVNSLNNLRHEANEKTDSLQCFLRIMTQFSSCFLSSSGTGSKILLPLVYLHKARTREQRENERKT